MSPDKSENNLIKHLKDNHIEYLSSKDNVALFIQNNISLIEFLEESEDEDNNFEETTYKHESSLNIANICCPFCDNIFSTNTQFFFHLNNHNEVYLGIENCCKLCLLNFKDKKEFLRHLQDVHVERALNDTQRRCRSCKFVCEDQKSLEAHIATEHHSVGKDVRTKNTSLELNKEGMIRSKNSKYIPVSCPDCMKTFSNKYNMETHRRSHSEQVSRFECDQCDKSYRNRSNLTYHKKLAHRGLLSYVCSFCGEAFPTRLARDVHLRLHTGEKPYSCPHCNKAFRAKNSLQRHLDVHLDIRKYNCRICTKKFRKKTHLDYHLTTHARKNET